MATVEDRLSELEIVINGHNVGQIAADVRRIAQIVDGDPEIGFTGLRDVVRQLQVTQTRLEGTIAADQAARKHEADIQRAKIDTAITMIKIVGGMTGGSLLAVLGQILGIIGG